MASKRTLVWAGGSSLKYYHGDLMVRSVILMLGLTGNWGRKGTGITCWSIGFFDGPNIVGESVAQLRPVNVAVSEGFDEAQAEEQIPPKYVEAHKHYFGELKKRVEAKEKTVDDGPDEEPSAPAEESEE